MSHHTFRVAIAGPPHPLGGLVALRERGYEVVTGPAATDSHGYLGEHELVELCRSANAIFVSPGQRIWASAIDSSPRLRIIVIPIIGVDAIDVKTATDCGVIVANSPAWQNFVGVAEAVIGLMVSLRKRLPHNVARFHRGEWRAPDSIGNLLVDTTLGLIGFGRIGREVAHRLSGWDMQILAFDPYVSQQDAASHGVRLVDLETLLRSSDLISLHVVLTPETQRMIGEKELELMQPTAYLINTSRGEVLDERAFVQAINKGWIAGAAIDVYEQEPLPMSSPLRTLDPEKVIFTPHCIGHNPDALVEGVKMAVGNVIRAFEGKPPEPTECFKNPEVLPRWQERFL
jgi:D-3-phosphoglycerate dehydrogenase